MPILETTTQHLVSISQETSASAEQMIIVSERQLEKIKHNDQKGKKLLTISASLQETMDRYQVNNIAKKRKMSIE